MDLANPHDSWESGAVTATLHDSLAAPHRAAPCASRRARASTAAVDHRRRRASQRWTSSRDARDGSL